MKTPHSKKQLGKRKRPATKRKSSAPAAGSEALSDRKRGEVKAALKLAEATAALRALVEAFEPLAAQIMANLNAPPND